MSEKKASKLHPFETSIGAGPYTFAGFGKIVFDERKGAVYYGPRLEDGCGTCAHCGMGITNIFIIKAGNGKLYGVGSSCIEKSNLPYEVKSQAKREKLKQDKIKRQQKDQEKALKCIEEIKQTIEENRSVLEKVPHPTDYLANEGKTVIDLFHYRLEGGGPYSFNSWNIFRNKYILSNINK